jgi:hypothetical protein
MNSWRCTIRYIFSYNILLAHEDESDGTESVGTGVMVRLGERHLIATAAHCIRRNPRVMREQSFFINKQNKAAFSSAGPSGPG